MSAELGLRRITDFSALEPLADSWNRLVDESVYPNVFLRWEWVSTWWKWFGNNRPLRVYLVYDGPQLVGILPLYARRWLRSPAGRRMVLAPVGFGGPTCPEYLGLVVHRNAIQSVVECLVEALRCPKAAWSVAELPDVAPDDSGTQTLVQAWSSRAPVLSRPGAVCPTCSLPKTYDELLGRLSRNRRWRERRRVRRARQECDAKLDVLDSPGEAEAFLPSLVRLSRSSRHRAGQSSPFDNERYTGFHGEVMRIMSAAGLLRIYVLYLKNRPAAFLYGFLYGGKYYFFQTGFDSEQSRLSPGDVLFQMTFQELIADGVREFDYLRGDEPYKYVFANRERRTTTFHVFRSVNRAYLQCWSRLHIASPLRDRAKCLLQRLHVRQKAGGKSAP